VNAPVRAAASKARSAFSGNRVRGGGATGMA
jgi:hypothetical protein